MSRIDQIRKELQKPEELKKSATILHDGKQFMIKIPKEISELFNMTKGNKFVFDIKIPVDHKEEIICSFYIKNDAQKKKKV